MMEKKNFKGINELNALKGEVTPLELENVLNSIRLQNDFVEIVERKIVEEKIEEAKEKIECWRKSNREH